MRAEDVATASRGELAELLRRGHAVDPDALVGADYHGVSLGLPRFVEKLTWKTFEKRFRQGVGGRVIGHNVRLSTGRAFGPFHVRELPACGTPFACRAGLLLDYGAAHPPWHPLAALRDPLVSLRAASADLLLGASYLALGGVRLRTPSFFTLERKR